MFKNMRLGLKIGLSFTIILVLLSMVLGVSMLALKKADEGIVRYEELATDTNLSSRLQANMLMVRMNVLGFLNTQSDKNLAQYKNYLDKMKTFLNEAKDKIKNPQRAHLVTSIDLSITQYENAFSSLVSLTEQRNNVLNDRLVPEGELMRKSIAAMIQSAYDDNDLQTVYRASKVQESLLFGRLLVSKFLNSTGEKEYNLAVMQIDTKLQKEVTRLQQYLQNNTHQNNLLSQFIAASQGYVDALNEMYRLIESRNELLDNTLYKVGPLVANHAEDLKLSVMAEQEELGSELKANTADSINFTELLSVVAIMIGIMAAYLLTISITRPISLAVQAANQLAEGDLTIELTSTSQDETGLLLQSIQGTATNLRNMVTTISRSSVELASASEELAVVTEQSSSGMINQQTETDLVATAMNEMAATVHDVASNAAQAAEAAKQADNEAELGGTVVEKAISAISLLADRVNESSDKLGEVELETINIGKILDVIRGIADQTNLLALNAAIEAARAGEQGRGFAVVADEVRSLAQRTQESTQEIQIIIEQLQAGTQNTVAVMEQGKVQAALSVEQVNETGSALQAITNSISVINDMNMQIASASEQQSSVAESINENVINVKRIAEENAIAANQTRSSTGDITKLSEQLRDLVTQFKI